MGVTTTEFDIFLLTMITEFTLRNTDQRLMKPLDQIRQLEQVLVPEQATAGGHGHERIFRQGRSPSGRNGAPPTSVVMKVDSVLAPVVAVHHQPELLAPQRMEGMGDLEASIASVAMPCS
jgi:hypothetical protein